MQNHSLWFCISLAVYYIAYGQKEPSFLFHTSWNDSDRSRRSYEIYISFCIPIFRTWFSCNISFIFNRYETKLNSVGNFSIDFNTKFNWNLFCNFGNESCEQMDRTQFSLFVHFLYEVTVHLNVTSLNSTLPKASL